MTEPFSLRGKTVCVTGAASGMGSLLALGVAKRGAAKVVLWDIDKKGLDAVKNAVVALGPDVTVSLVDVGDQNNVAKAAKKALKAHGTIDVLINNAGVVSGKEFLELAPEDIERTFRVNTLALYWTTAEFLPGMLAANAGRIVTIASAAGFSGVAKQSDYSASKHAAVGFTESLRAELRQKKSGVTTLTVAPYYVNTGMFDGVKSGSSLLPIQEAPATVERILNAIESTRREVLIPNMVWTVRLFRLLPATWFDAISDLFGINKSMAAFRGRTHSGARGGT
jgi:all-trans-retinol dehydrogenase (NAD+)